MKQVPSLTDTEIEVLRAGKENPSILTDYFFRPYGSSKGWRFDDNFDIEGAWQESALFATQRDIRVSGGVGSGKTQAIIMGASCFCLTNHPNFKFMNVGPTVFQAKQAYQMLMDLSANTPFQRLIYKSPERPYPMIELRFRVKNVTVSNTMYFMSIDKNAKNIFSTEVDWMNIEEAGLIDDLEDVLISVGTRTRGTFRGRTRLGRLSMITNPWDNPFFWYLFDMAQGDPENCLSMVVSTRHNKNITDDQLAAMVSRIPESERDRFIDGARPEGKGNYFSKEAVYACEDEGYGIIIQDNARNNVPGFAVSKIPGIGVDYFTTPPSPKGVYMLFGDPGTGSAPNRNAPTWMVFDVQDFPLKRADLVAAWWGNGDGSIAPWAIQMGRFVEMYPAEYILVDSTATQKNSAQMLKELIKNKDDEGKSTLFGVKFSIPDTIVFSGLDFSGMKKAQLLSAAMFLVEAKLFRWPKFFYGLRSQLTNYDPYKDSDRKSKVPQDLVVTLAMAAFFIRRFFHITPTKYYSEVVGGQAEDLGINYLRNRRNNRRERSRRSTSRDWENYAQK